VRTNFLNNLGKLKVDAGDTMVVSSTQSIESTSIKIGGDIEVDGGLIIEVDPVLHPEAEAYHAIFTGNGDTDIYSAATHAPNPPGSLALPGTTIKPGHSPGKLDIIAHLAFKPDTSLDVELAGLTQGVTYDLLNVTNHADLDGSLSVSLLSGFVPQIGDSFEVLKATLVSGQFAATSLPHCHPVASGTWFTIQTR